MGKKKMKSLKKKNSSSKKYEKPEKS